MIIKAADLGRWLSSQALDRSIFQLLVIVQCFMLRLAEIYLDVKCILYYVLYLTQTMFEEAPDDRCHVAGFRPHRDRFGAGDPAQPEGLAEIRE